jgi:hypothetical protein
MGSGDAYIVSTTTSGGGAHAMKMRPGRDEKLDDGSLPVADKKGRTAS